MVRQQMRLVFEEPLPETAPASAPASAPPASREQLKAERDRRRSRRRRDVRAKTVSITRLPKRDLELGRALYPEDEHADIERPKTRADCKGGQRPCPFVSCKHHLYLDVSAKTGAIKVNFPDLEPWELEESCSLDIADRGGATLEEAGAIMNLTRERIRQIEVGALAKAAAVKETEALRDFYGDAVPRSKRRLPIVSEERDEDEEDEDADAGDAFDVETFAGPELDDDGA